MSEIQQAREVFATWRQSTSPGPWTPQVWDSDGEAELCAADGGLILGALAADYPSTMSGPDARLAAGMTDPALLDAIDEILDRGTYEEEDSTTNGGFVRRRAQRLATAILAANERISA